MTRRLLSTALAMLLAPALICQGADGWYRRFDDAVRRILLSGVDTNYVALPKVSWEIPVVNNVYGNSYLISTGTADGSSNPTGGNVANGTTGGNGGAAEGHGTPAGPVDISSGPVHEAGIGIGYHGLDYVQTFRYGERGMTRYFSFDFYDNAWGAHIVTSEKRQDGIGAAYMTLSGYYAFNGRHFSYPASFYGNYIQKRSAGSPMLNFWYNHLHLYNVSGGDRTDGTPSIGSDTGEKGGTTDSGVGTGGTSKDGESGGSSGNDRVKTIPAGGFDVANFALCGGYAYNWAFDGGRAVLTASGCAGIVVPLHAAGKPLAGNTLGNSASINETTGPGNGQTTGSKHFAIAPCWGFAAEARVGGMYWFSDNLRGFFSAILYYNDGSNASQTGVIGHNGIQTVASRIRESEWRTTIGLAYCF